jgi:hypothetical protein
MPNWLGWGIAGACFAIAFVKLRQGEFWLGINLAVFGGICWGLTKIFAKSP